MTTKQKLGIVIALAIAIVLAIIYFYRKRLQQAMDYLGFVTSTKVLGTEVPFSSGNKLDPDELGTGLVGIKSYQLEGGKLTPETINDLKKGDIRDLGIIGNVKYARISWNYSYLTGIVRDFDISLVLDSPNSTPSQIMDSVKSISWLTPVYEQLKMPEKPVAWTLNT